MIADDVFRDAIVQVVGPDTMVSDPCLIKVSMTHFYPLTPVLTRFQDISLSTAPRHQSNFSSPFELISTAERRTKVRAFLLYFETFFTVTGEPVPAEMEAQAIKEGDPVLAEVWPVGGKMLPQRRQSQGQGLKGKENERIISFTTSPKSFPTHWEQTIFLLREPITVSEGTVVCGTFYCRKGDSNPRELQVEVKVKVSLP